MPEERGNAGCSYVSEVCIRDEVSQEFMDHEKEILLAQAKKENRRSRRTSSRR